VWSSQQEGIVSKTGSSWQKKLPFANAGYINAALCSLKNAEMLAGQLLPMALGSLSQRILCA
jgi:hypothetical protein